MVLMFQKELADRICADSGSKAYGIPSVLVNMYTLCTCELNIPRQCFYPQPKVDSSVLKMIVRKEPHIDLKDHDFFNRIVKIAFAKRRKTLMNNLKVLLKGGYSEEALHEALENSGIDSNRRGETLTAVEYGLLSNALLKKYS